MSRTEAVLLPWWGQPVLLAVPMPDDAPADVLEGLVRRRLTATTGECPCGATMRQPSRAERRAARGRVLVTRVEHEDDCPAVCVELLSGRWSA